jgi:hypothetical protein
MSQEVAVVDCGSIEYVSASIIKTHWPRESYGFQPRRKIFIY